MLKVINWFRKDIFAKLFALLVLGVAIFFRFYDYYDRISILADNSRDVQVAKYAIDNFRIPQIGQFSSAGRSFMVLGTTGY
ncbi:MAG: hypothetical protein UR98_C0001G0080 [Parcubacteria group bacterium GW2011_GWA1_36_12]|nr:MAG: hypothetical protein UR98_C0001G0080 [Parcubacteria group bacterium GW2011_GWA1_36_12]